MRKKAKRTFAGKNERCGSPISFGPVIEPLEARSYLNGAAPIAVQADVSVAFKAPPTLEDFNSGRPVLVIVTNEGPAPAKGKLWLRFGRQGVSSPQLIEPLSTVVKPGNLKPGKSRTFAIAEDGWSSPESSYPTVTVDPQKFYDTNLGNNTVISPNALPASQVDLALAFNKIPTTHSMTGRHPVAVTITNLGNVSVNGTLYASVKGTVVSDSSVISLFNDEVIGVDVAPGQSQTILIPLARSGRNGDAVVVYPTVNIDLSGDLNPANNTIVSPTQVTLRRLIPPTPRGGGGGGGISIGWCFLTTACTQARGLSDDCDELRTLRAVRDAYLVRSKHGRALVAEYYRFAPRLCALISRHPQAIWVYDEMYRGLVMPSVRLARAGNLLAACDHYERFTLELCSQFDVGALH